MFGKIIAKQDSNKNKIMGTLFRRLLIYAAPLLLGYFMKKWNSKKQTSLPTRKA